MTPEIFQSNQPIFGYTPDGNPIYVASPKEALRKVNGLTDTACSAFDHYSLARCIMTGYTALSNPLSQWQEVGEKILQNTEKYLSETGVFTRLLLPFQQGTEGGTDEDIRAAQALSVSVRTMLAQAPETYLSRQTQKKQNDPLRVFSDRYAKTFAYLRDFSEKFLGEISHRNTDPFQRMYSYYSDEIHSQLFGGNSDNRSWIVGNEQFRLDILGFDERKYTLAHHPDELVERIIRSDQHCPVPALRSWDRQIAGGETLERLFTTPVTDIDTYGKRILNFLANLPKGDLYYQRLAESLFFTAASRVNPDGYGLGNIGDASARILLFQRWLADRLVAPAFGEPPVPGFDALLQKVTEKSSPVADITFAKCIADAYPTDRFSQLAADGLLHTHPELPEIPSVDRWLGDVWEDKPVLFYEDSNSRYASVVSGFFRANLPRLHESFDSRFTGSKRLRTILSTFVESDFAMDPGTIERVLFTESLAEWSGTIFFGNLMAHSDQIHEVKRELWEDIGRHCSFFPAENTIHHITFSPGSLPEIVGLRTLELMVGPADETGRPGDVWYRIKTKEREYTITGHFSRSSERSECSPEGENEQAAVGFADMIALAGLRDLEDRVVIERKAERQILSGTSELDSKSDTPVRKRKHPSREQSRPLPLHRLILGPIQEGSGMGDSPEESIPSDELSKRIGREKAEGRPFTPRMVTTYPRHLPGWREFRETITRLAANFDLTDMNEENRQAFGVLLDRVISKFGAHAKKDFPDAILAGFDSMPHPITGEPIYLSTQVSGYESPKMSDDERKNIVVRLRRYRATSSALEYIESLKTWFTTSADPAS